LRIRFKTDLGEVVNATINGMRYTAIFHRIPKVRGVYAEAHIDCGGGYKSAAVKKYWIAPAQEGRVRSWPMDVAG
jgi:hypothetical protein